MNKITVIILIIILLLFAISLLVQADKGGEIATNQLIHVVEPGDSLYKLARKYGTTIELIKKLNNLQSTVIYIGEELKIPEADDIAGTVYIIQPGDSLFKLAIRFNTTIARLKELNQLTSDTIYIGEKLIVAEENEVNEDIISVSGKIIINNKTLDINGTLNRDKMDKISTEMVSSLNTKAGINNSNLKEIIVKYRARIGSQSIRKLENNIGVTAAGSLNHGEKTFARYQIKDEQQPENIIKQFEENAEVEWAEPNYIYYPTAIPSDSYYESQQWNYRNINMEAAWDQEKGSDSIIVAVLDTGIITDHPDLKDNLLPGADFVGGENTYPISAYEMTDSDPTDETTLLEGGSHGTHVAGIIGAVTNNYRGIAGLNWTIKILPVRVLKKSGGTSWDIVEGLYYALAQDADVINISLGSTARSRLIEEAIKDVVNSGVTVIAAAGNNGNEQVYFPAAFQDVIAVGSVDINNEKTTYSNYGPEIDVVAPGGGYGSSIYSTWGYYEPETGKSISSYGGMIGTSMATPHVSGLAALLTASGIEDPRDIRSRLINTTVDLGKEGKDPFYGYGLIDGYATLLGKKLSKPLVFAGIDTGESIEVKSKLVEVNEKGKFQLEEIDPGNLNIYGWRDVNENSVIDRGDYYGYHTINSDNIDKNITSIEFEIGYISDPNFLVMVD